MQPEPIVNVLLVDDHPENLIALEAILAGLGQNLVKAQSGQEALRCLLSQDFAVILLDVHMPDMDGFETAALIRQRPRLRNTPIIFVTAFNTSDDLMVKGYSLGAVDYLFKPINPAILTSKVAVFVDLFKKNLEVERQAAQLAVMNGELQQSEERFRLLSRCSPIGIFLMDTDGNYTYANPNCQAICGFTIQENWKTDWTQNIHSDDRERVLQDWSIAIQHGKAYSEEFRIQVNADLRWVHVRTAPMLSDSGDLLGHVGTIEDVTDQKQANEARDQIIREQAARQQAETANRMKDEFLAIVSHELRTPLNSILGWSQLLLNRKLDEATTIRALQTIERNARSQAQLIEDILDVSQIIRGKLRLVMQPLSLIPLIEAVIETVRLTAEDKSIQINTLFAPSPVKVYGDAERLRQVIWNLLSNAIKFTPEQGQITIKLHPISKQEHDSLYQSSYPTQSSRSSLEYSACHPCIEQLANVAAYAQLQVVDTGIGINAEFLPHVFDRFRQADSTTTRPYGGLGLGLAIVHHLVEQHCGTIHADSQGQDQGATFTVNLPLLTDALLANLCTSSSSYSALPPPRPLSAAIEPPPESIDVSRSRAPSDLSPTVPSPSTDLKHLQILLVEDHYDTRDFLTSILQQFGANVTAVASAREALRHLEQTHPHVLISDIGMPIEDGYQLIQKVRDRELQQNQHLNQHLPAIALSAYARDEDRQKAIHAGFEMHVSKPVEPKALVAAVANVTRGQNPRQHKT
jgi:hypothetical protein